MAAECESNGFASEVVNMNLVVDAADVDLTRVFREGDGRHGVSHLKHVQRFFCLRIPDHDPTIVRSRHQQFRPRSSGRNTIDNGSMPSQPSLLFACRQFPYNDSAIRRAGIERIRHGVTESDAGDRFGVAFELTNVGTLSIYAPDRDGAVRGSSCNSGSIARKFDVEDLGCVCAC